MDGSVDNFAIIGILAVVALFMAMFVALAFGMSVKHVPWFLAAMFAVLSVLLFREHWAVGVFTLIVGTGGVAFMVGLRRLSEKDRAKAKAKAKASA